MRFVRLPSITSKPGKPGMVQCLISTTLPQSWVWTHVLALELPWISRYHVTHMKAITVLMSHSQFRNEILILRHAWLNLWDKHMTTGRINQVHTIWHRSTEGRPKGHSNMHQLSQSENIRFNLWNRWSRDPMGTIVFNNSTQTEAIRTNSIWKRKIATNLGRCPHVMSNATSTGRNTRKLTNAPNINNIVAGTSRTNEGHLSITRWHRIQDLQNLSLDGNCGIPKDS